MYKKVIVLALICSILAPSLCQEKETKASNSEKSTYIIISEDGTSTNVDTAILSEDQAESLKDDDNIIIVEEDSYVYGLSNEEVSLDKDVQEKTTVVKDANDCEAEWNMDMINQDSTVAYSDIQVDNPDTSVESASGSAIKVAVIDSGIDWSEDIDVYERKDFISDDNDEMFVLFEDLYGHGTSVAGIIAAKDNEIGITGINPNVQLYSARVLDDQCKSPISRVVESIYWAIEQDVDIINISFGTRTDSEALHKAIQDAYNSNILVIAAAGNHGIVEYPAAYDEVMAVGSVDTNGEVSDTSATGELLEVVAPGEQIKSSGAFDGEVIVSGTSMAVPHVTGVASVLWQRDKNVSNAFIRQLINYSANLYGDKNEYGNGLVDLSFALEQYEAFRTVYEEVNNESVNKEDDLTKGSEETTELPEEDQIIVEEGTEVAEVVSDSDKESTERIEESSEIVYETTDKLEDIPENSNPQFEIPTDITEDNTIIVKDTLEENKEAVTVYDNVDYVVGSWVYTDHEACIVSGTTAQIAIIKKGAIYQDRESTSGYLPINSGLAGMGSNPFYHGYYTKNYLAGYIYLTFIANNYGLSTNYSYGGSTGVYTMNSHFTQSNNIKYINGQSYSTIFSKMNLSSYSVNDTNIRLFVWGMAIHTATDVFAHSAWEINSKGIYERIKHDVKSGYDQEIADDPDYNATRYKAAQAVAIAALKNCYNNKNGTVLDFDTMTYNKKFYIYNMCTYAKQLGVTPSTNLTYLDLTSNTNNYVID